MEIITEKKEKEEREEGKEAIQPFVFVFGTLGRQKENICNAISKKHGLSGLVFKIEVDIQNDILPFHRYQARGNF